MDVRQRDVLLAGVHVPGGEAAPEFIEITEDKENQIVKRIRAQVIGANNG